MSTTTTSIEPTPVIDRSNPTTLWRVGGALALAHVVMLFAAISQEVMVTHDASFAKLQDAYGGANLNRVFAAGYVESLSFLVLTAAIVVIARLFGRTPAGSVASQTFLALGVVFVAATLAVGFAPGAAAMYGAQHGADVHTVAVVNDVRNYGYILQVAIQGAMALALGIAALADHRLTKWVGWGGVVAGSLTIIVTPFTHDAFAMVWMVWWVGLAVLLLRGPRKRA
jgi:hypothetical protein